MKLSLPAVIFLALIGLLAALFVAQAFMKRGDEHSFLGNKFDKPDRAEMFQLTDHHGAPFDLKSLRGKLVLLTFGFTHCPDICPTILTSLADAIQELTPEEQARVQVVFVTLDPERDTAAVLKDYVPFFNDRFIGITGTPEEIAVVAKKYHVFFKKAPLDNGSYNVDHSTHLYLIDPAGNFAVLYDSKEITQANRLAGDIRAILNSPSK